MMYAQMERVKLGDSAESLQDWLKGNGVSLPVSEVYALYAQHDDNNDGVLQEDEFAELLRRAPARVRALRALLTVQLPVD